MLGQLKRTMIHWDHYTLKNLYTTYVRPHLEYASSACCPYRHKDVKVLETIQRRATKLVPQIKSLAYETRLKELNLTTLEERRARGDAIQFFKFDKGFNRVTWYHPNSLTNSTQLAGPAGNIRGHKHRLSRQFTRNCDQREHFFTNRVVPIWNNLPEEVINSESVNEFKNRYDKFINKSTN